MKFVAIDFETANEKRNSPCSIGIVVVENGHIIEKVYHLIRPKEMRFMPINIGIHGIRPSMVENELEFDDIWHKIKHYFDESIVIAHNASFDISVLRNTLELYEIEMPNFEYICTMKLSRNFYSNIDNAKLITVNRFLGYEFKHHDALADALACSNILLNICKELKSIDIKEISRLVGVTIGNITNNGYKPSSTKGKILKTSNRQSPKKDDTTITRENINVFKDEVVVFTGGLVSMTRDEAIKLVENFGGTIGSSVTKKTTIIVTNMKNIQGLHREEMSTKLKRAIDLIENNQKISFVDEEEFLKKLKEA